MISFRNFIIFFLGSCLFEIASCRIQYAPTWLTSNYIRAGNRDLFTVLTGSTVAFSYTFPFSSNLTGIPLLGYGIKAYQGSYLFYLGNDYFGQQRFEVNRTQLTPASFTVTVQLIGATNLYILNVPYIAIDPQFPHHVNSFDNVPVNYSAGPLVNVSVKNYFNPVYYQNVINYTEQAASTKYSYFSTPLQNNKILLFMTSMYITGINQPADALVQDYNPLNLHIYYQILTNQTYLLNVSLSIKINLQRLQYSMIIFDQADVESSHKYYLVYQLVNFTDSGGFIPVPIEFIDNFIMGFTQFSSNKTMVAIHFSWDFTYVDGVHGVLMPVSIPRSPAGTVINRIQFTVFYMKTWKCPNQTFINLTTNMCEQCSIEGCATCLTLEICEICDNGNHYKLQNQKCVRCDVDNNYYLNKTTMECQYCESWICPPPKIQKQMCNTMLIKITSTPIFPVYCNSSDIYIQNQGISITSSEIVQNQFSNQISVLYILADYNRQISENQTIIIYLGSRDRRVLPKPVTTLLSYNPEQCSIQSSVKSSMEIISIISYVILFFSLFSCKIIGLELFGVLQLAYYSLGSYSYLDIYIALLSQLKITNGFNLNNVANEVVPSQIFDYIGIKSSFINNVNIMGLLIPAVPLFIAPFIIYTKLTLNKLYYQRFKMLLKQGLVTLVMFNIFNVSYSTGIHIKYASINHEVEISQFVGSTIFMCCLIALCLGFLVYLETSNSSQYGEFKNKFKTTWICNMYIFFSIIYRMALGLYLSLQSHYQESTLIVLAISLVFIMYFIVNLPFTSPAHNYRSGFCHIVEIIILFVANYYRSMKSNLPLSIKSNIHTPALIVIFMIGFCILFSGLALCWEIFQALRLLWQKRKLPKVVDDSRRNTQASMAQLHTN